MLKDLILATRSYRGFDKSRPVTEDELKELISLTCLMPSSINKQPLKFRPVWKKEEVDKVQPLTGWAMNLPEMQLPHPGKCPAAFIVICLDTTIYPNKATYLKDVGFTAYGMLLRATEMGLGGCMIGNFQRKALMDTLGLPEHLDPQLVVAFGKPDETIVLTDVPADGNTAYYRDAQDVHYVPKRKPEDVIL